MENPFEARAYEEAAKLYKEGAALSTRAFKFLQTNWKPALAVTSVAAAGTYMMLRSRKPKQTVRHPKQKTH